MAVGCTTRGIKGHQLQPQLGHRSRLANQERARGTLGVLGAQMGSDDYDDQDDHSYSDQNNDNDDSITIMVIIK